MIEILAWASLLGGAGFFAAGTVGLLRFPDTLTRLHALTKADNAGLGLVVLGLALRSGSVTTAVFLLLVWVLVLLASGTLSALLASAAAED
ncbi:MAG TPA: monovalent cation/H(+) antiporter subunit G [Gammaproteobacteria bacterium]|nr:monovalent cation/H(+) antiporter subunit G [Gammaproteobacteria bacterium]